MTGLETFVNVQLLQPSCQRKQTYTMAALFDTLPGFSCCNKRINSLKSRYDLLP